jgi:hypothetical protein
MKSTLAADCRRATAMDRYLLLLSVLLLLTLGAFFAGFIRYPVGWLILSALLIMRINQLRKQKHKNKAGVSTK